MFSSTSHGTVHHRIVSWSIVVLFKENSCCIAILAEKDVVDKPTQPHGYRKMQSVLSWLKTDNFGACFVN
jgi:hypothetical protein